MTGAAWPELVWSRDHDRGALSRAAGRGTLRRLAPGLYTGAVHDDAADVVRRNLWAVVGRETPGAVVADRSARVGGPVDEDLYVVHTRDRPLDLPGLRIVPRPGPGPLERDMPLPNGLYLASDARTMLEGLMRPGGRRLDRADIEAWIDDLCVHGGALRLNAVRDLAKRIAPALRAERALVTLERLIAAALVTGDAAHVSGPALAARAVGHPYDAVRVDRFATLAAHLHSLSPRIVPDLAADRPKRVMLPFYEAYFSNFIEGTEFTLDEAARIVFDGVLPEARPADAHDIVGTYAIVADPIRRRESATDGAEFTSSLRRFHAELMGGRPDKRPGEYKHLNNRAGSTELVAPEHVDGTLRRGFDVGAHLLDPFHRACYLMFVVAEVHPFVDGNGRTARIVMNAELTKGGQARIVIPTVFRLNYLAALKAATHNDTFAPLVSVLEYAQRFAARVDFTNRATAEADLERTNALRDPYDAEQAGVRLLLP